MLPTAQASRAERAATPSSGPAAIPPVELGIDQRTDADAVDSQLLDLAVDGGANHLDATHFDLAPGAADQDVPSRLELPK
jgi:hypothetical protein